MPQYLSINSVQNQSWSKIFETIYGPDPIKIHQDSLQSGVNAKCRTCEIADITPSAHAQSNIPGHCISVTMSMRYQICRQLMIRG